MTERSEHSPFTSRDSLFVAALIVLTFAVYSPVLKFDFLSWDDNAHVVENPLFNPPRIQNLSDYWLHPFHGLYIPVTYSLWTVVGLIGMKAWLFHAANLIVHAVCVALVYLIIRRIITMEWPAFLGAAIFAVHPVQVETVAWISAFRDLLGAMFMFVAVLLYLRGKLVATLIAFILAILSKPTTVVLPLILLILDRLPPSPGTPGEGRGKGSALSEATVHPQKNPHPPLSRSTGRGNRGTIFTMFGIAIACSVWTRLIQPSNQLRPSPLWSRPLVALDALAFYLYQLLWPAKLGFDYGRTPQEILANGQAYFSWIIPVGVAIIVIALSRRWRMIAIASLIFLAGVLPVLGLAPFDFQDKSTVADHYLYVSMLGIALLVATVAARCERTSTRSVAGVVIIAFAIASWLQTWTWRDTQALAENGLRVNPRSWVSLNLLAFASTDPHRAERLARESLDIRPDQVDAMLNLGVALQDQDRLGEAVAVFERAVQLHPDVADAHANLAATYGRLGRFSDAQTECDTALRIDPNHRQARFILGLLRQAPATTAATTTTRSSD